MNQQQSPELFPTSIGTHQETRPEPNHQARVSQPLLSPELDFLPPNTLVHTLLFQPVLDAFNRNHPAPRVHASSVPVSFVPSFRPTYCKRCPDLRYDAHITILNLLDRRLWCSWSPWRKLHCVPETPVYRASLQRISSLSVPFRSKLRLCLFQLGTILGRNFDFISKLDTAPKALLATGIC